MIAHFAIASKIWHAIGTDVSKPNISKEEVGYLDFQIVNWHRTLPDHLRYDPSTSPRQRDPTLTPGQHRLQIILYLRTNGMRILIYRPVLHSATSIVHNRDQAQTVVDVAKDTIRLLTLINQTSKMYHSSQVLFNAFLTSALAVLFLAVSHAPSIFSEQVREEFYLALDLVRGFSKGSWVSNRLWKTIRILKEVGPKLGLFMKMNNASAVAGAEQTPSQHRIQSHSKHHEDPSHSAALAMAGLAGHNVDETALFGTGNPWPVGSVSSNSPENMVHDLTNLFEAAGGYNTNGAYNGLGETGGAVSNNGYSISDIGHGDAGTPSLQMVGFGSEDELSKIMRDLF